VNEYLWLGFFFLIALGVLVGLFLVAKKGRQES
jgi:hypothetical protein